MRKPENNEIIEDISFDTTDETPLKDSTARTLNHYNNTAQNQRTDAVINVLEKIHFWLAIIGIYFLAKITIIVFLIISFIQTGKEITNILNSIF